MCLATEPVDSSNGGRATAQGQNQSKIHNQGFNRVSMSERPKKGKGQMRVLFIPLEADPKTNDRSPTHIRVMLRRHKLIGPQRVPYSEGSTRFITYVKYLCFAFAVFWYGIRHRKSFDVIFCENAIYGLGAAPIALITRKPLVLDCHGHESTYAHELGRSSLYTF